MLADVERAHVNHLFGFVQHLGTGVLLLQVRLLLIGESLRVALKPDVNRRLVLFQFHQSALVQQRHDSTVGHGLVDRIGVDHATEFCDVTLLAREQRRASKADVACIGEHLPHARRVAAQLCALGFVDQHEDVG